MKIADAALYALLLALGLTGAILIEIVPQYMLATNLVYGNF
jgi:hypothetical protein